ncbi:MAG: carotenoid biosynthesis protein [Alphaproteobacteria bacterium]|nr:carotenoid biosynthesis protein [Alphaproteobacteria bacterium]
MDTIWVEGFVFGLFGLAVVTGFRGDVHRGATVLAASSFGLLVELYFLTFAQGYAYGEFTLMLHGAPLWVAAGWGFILAWSLEAAERLPIRRWGVPFVAACMATGLDLMLDPIAEARGWWHWKRPDPGFFGVSYDNFSGWLVLVASFVGAQVALTARFGTAGWRAVVFPFLGIPAAIVGVVGVQPLLEAAYRRVGEGPVFLALWTLFLAVGLAAHGRWPVLPGALLPLAFFVLLVPVGAMGPFQDHTELYGVFAASLAFGFATWLPRTGPS